MSGFYGFFNPLPDEVSLLATNGAPASGGFSSTPSSHAAEFRNR